MDSCITNSQALLKRRLNDLDNTVDRRISKVDQSTEELMQAVDACSKNLNHNDRRMGNTMDSCITNSQARLNNLDDAIEIRVNQVNKAIERYITTIDSSTQKASNKFSSDQQALIKRLQEFGQIYVEEESVEEVLCKCSIYTGEWGICITFVLASLIECHYMYGFRI